MKDSFRANLLEQLLYYPPKEGDDPAYAEIFKEFVKNNWNRKELEDPIIGK